MQQQAFRSLASWHACKAFSTSTTSTETLYDIAIVGAGLTGAALAAGLGIAPNVFQNVYTQTVVVQYTTPNLLQVLTL